MPHQVMAAVGFNSQQLPREPLTRARVRPALVQLVYECMALRWQDRPSVDQILARLEPISEEYRQQQQQQQQKKQKQQQQQQSSTNGAVLAASQTAISTSTRMA